MSEHEDVMAIMTQRGLSREQRVARIVEYFAGPIHEAWPCNTHVAIETVEIYGLRIGVDANGYAAEVRFPDGAEF